MKTKSVLLCWLFVCWVGPATLWAQAPEVRPGAQAIEARAPRQIMEFRHPETHQRVVVSMANLEPQELRKFSPSKIRKSFVPRPSRAKGGFSGAMATLAHEYPTEWTAFSLAIGLSAKSQMQNDPAALKHFWEQSIIDPVAHVAFGGFLMGSRASTSFLAATGLAYDPYRAPIAEYRIDSSGGLNRLQIHQIAGPPTRVQKMFAPLVGPMGLGVGMTFSSIITEMLKDPELAMCAKSMVSASVDRNAAAAACDKAWENWAVSKKIMDYAPDVFSMMSSALVQAYLVNYPAMKAAGLVGQVTRKGVERFVPVMLRGLTVAWQYGSIFAGGPVVRFAIAVGNVYVFMEINEFILPYLKKPWEQWRQGKDITNSIAELEAALKRSEAMGTEWTPRQTDCGGLGEMDAMGLSTGIPLTMPCPAEETPVQRLARLSEKQKKWRQQILADAFSVHSNWQEYVANFATLYANAYSFYSDVANNIHWHRTEPAKRITQPAMLYESTPFSGVYLDPKAKDLASTVKAAERAVAYGESYLRDPKNLSRRFDHDSRAQLEQILRGLRAIDPKIRLGEFWPESSFNMARAQSAQISDREKSLIESKLRGQFFEASVRQLREILRTDLRWTDHGFSFPGPGYESLASYNPFAKLRILLGNPNPQPAGVAYLLEFNDDPAQIAQDSKANHPAALGRIQTRSMTEYLLASMICGPEVEVSTDAKIKIYRARAKGGMDHFLSWFGLASAPALQNVDAATLVEVEKQFDESVAPKKASWAGAGPHQLSHEFFGFSATFRPPRLVDNVPQNLCNSFSLNHNRNQPWVEPHDAQYKVGDKTYTGLLEIVRENIKSSVVGSTPRPEKAQAGWQSDFDKWWSIQVDPHVKRTLEKFRTDFKAILTEKYLPALNGTGDVVYNERSFKLGALASLQDEVDLYLGWAQDLTVNGGSNSEAQTTISQQANVYRLAFLDLSQSMNDLGWVQDSEKDANANFKKSQEAIKAAREALKLSLATALAARPLQLGISEQIFKNLEALSGEVDSYFGILRTLKVTGQ